MNILGVKVDNFTKQETLNKISEFLFSNKSHKIFTPNPEMLVDAQKDQYFREILNSGDLNVCDGFGLSLVSGIKRYPGIDLMLDICNLAQEKNKSIFLLGSGDFEIIKETAEVLQKKIPKIKIVGFHPGNKIKSNFENNRKVLIYNKEENDDLIDDIILLAPDILFVGFGHGKQEKWIDENIADLPSLKIVMGVGGSFDFISGKIKRAPKFLRQIGLEWLYRLIKQPSRINRIFKATFIFIFKVLANKNN